MLSVGLVGLPNAGKSTLFNLLTARSVPAENFPFCTIEPTDGIVEVTDYRIKKLAEIVKAKKEVYSMIEFKDIAGLVKNAHQGAGLGNQFLSHIRECDMILMVIRCFENDDIIHVENRVDPNDDAEILMLELSMADQNSVEKMIPRLEKELKTGKDKLGNVKIELLQKIQKALNDIIPASTVTNPENCDVEVVKWRKSLNLLTDKPVIRLANINYDGKNVEFKADFELDIKAESELADLTREERIELGANEKSGLDRMITACYQTLGLASFLTAGEIEARSWTFKQGITASQCAGIIHTDFEKKFIKAEVISYEDFIALGSRKACIENGKARQEGRDYLMQDGDVVEFKIGG